MAAGEKRFMILVVLLSVGTLDAKVCVLRDSCILSCTFKHGQEVVIHWIQTAGNTPVHSYYRNQDQLARQNERFKGRTSLFKDQISTGNASLQLTNIQIQDEGKYNCYTSTISGNKEAFVTIDVEEPVREVNIQRVGNRTTCRSEGIYPEPELTWSTDPPSTLTPDKPTVQQTEQQLYSINSSVIFSDNVDYSCTVSSGTNRKTATLFKPISVSGSETETTIPCTASNRPVTGLIWRFNHSEIILTQTETSVPYAVTEEWKQKVKSVSASGSLTLKDLSSSQEGIYTCKISNAEETSVTNIFLMIEQHQGPEIAGITVGVIIAILVVIGLVLCFTYKKQIYQMFKKTETSHENDPEVSEVQASLNKNHEGNNSAEIHSMLEKKKDMEKECSSEELDSTT